MSNIKLRMTQFEALAEARSPFNWREWAQEWDRMFTTDRGNWLQKSGMGHSWAYESFNALPRSIQEAFAAAFADATRKEGAK